MDCRKRFALIFYLFMPLLLASCSSIVNSHGQKENMMNAYLAGSNDKVLEKLQDELENPGMFTATTVGTGDETMWRLEAGSFYLHSGKYADSIRELTIAENLIEEYNSRAVVNMRQIGAETSVLLVNPNTLPYRAFCRDRIMCVLLRGLAYLGRGDEDGFRTELFRLREVQNKVADDNRKYFKTEQEALEKSKKKNKTAAESVNTDELLARQDNQKVSEAINATMQEANKGYANYLNPMAIFLSGYGFARDGNWENAVVDFKRLYEAVPNQPTVRRYYADVLRKTNRPVPSELKNMPELGFDVGRDNVLVIFANGRSAAFRQIALYIPIIFPGYFTIATVAWPVCEYYAAPFRSMTVTVNGIAMETQSISNMDGILSLEYKDRLPGMITRIVLSTAVKETASYFATRAAAEANEWAGVGVAIGTSIYKSLFNTADTRTWEILPKEFQIVQFAMPKNRTITLSPGGAGGKQIRFSPEAKSAIIYVNAPSASAGAVSYHVFELKKQ